MMDELAAHLVGDYILQTPEEAMGKLTSERLRARHVTKYAACFVPIALLTRQSSWKRRAAYLIGIWVLHYITDSKRWIPNEDWPPGTIINDQALHAVQLAVLRRVLAGSNAGA